MEKLKENKPIQELAANPLLLTLLCLVFGEAGDFPVKRSELYTEGVNVFLKKWDVGRNIERDQIYKELSLQGKENLLSHIALTTFEQKNYFFKKKTVEEYITDFIRNLRNARIASEELELDSEAILKSIEAQHGLLVARATGIYSFSHLTFHEYFTAREIKETSAWSRLADHVTEKRWREVFLLTTGLMRSADELLKLMKQRTDELLALDEKLQQFLTWVKEKSDSVEAPYKRAAVRAFYLDRALDRDPELKRSLQQLKDQLSNPKNKKTSGQWWQQNGEAWTEQLRTVMIEHRNIGHDWQFSDEQRELLKQYYDANKLLVDCLNSDCYVSREVRQEIEDKLLLPAFKESN
ncbi:MAG: hypothetical protein PUP92_33795 [Rhizonema sp. PD38]|nr:hypothetical protein [Rhizonema sp. PD38]